MIYVGQAGQGVARTGVLWRIPLLPGRMLCYCYSDRSPLEDTPGRMLCCCYSDGSPGHPSYLRGCCAAATVTGVLCRTPLLPGRMLCCCCSDRSPLSWTFCLSRSIAWAVRGPAWVSTWLYNWLALAVCSCCWSFTIWLKGIIIQYAHTESMRIQILINFLFICLNTVLYFSSNESAARFSTLL